MSRPTLGAMPALGVHVTRLLFALLLLVPARALANSAAAERPGPPAGNVVLGTPTSIAVERELLEIRCKELDGQPECTFRATYFLFNPDRAPAHAVAAFWGEAAAVTLEIGGRHARSLSDAELQAITRAFSSREAPDESAPGPHSSGIDISLGAGGRAELVARGSLHLGWAGGRGYALGPVHARHQLIQPDPPRTPIVQASYFLSPIRTFRSAGPITLVVEHPSSWAPSIWLETTDGAFLPVELEGGRATIASDRARMVRLSFDRSPTVLPGGPFAGIGGAFGEGGGFRLRAGYELAAPSWLLWSVTAETDAESLFVVTPLLEVASDQVLIIPSFGLGAGVPVRIEPEQAVGARLQASISFYKIGVVGSLDFFPRGDAGEAETRWSLLGYFYF
jgi:hypothetical protein